MNKEQLYSKWKELVKESQDGRQYLSPGFRLNEKDLHSVYDNSIFLFIEFIEPLSGDAEKDKVVAVPDEKELNLYKMKVEFYRNETDKVRKFVFDNNEIGEPCQPLFDAIHDKLMDQQKTIDGLKILLASTQPYKDWSEIEKRVREKFEIGERGRTFKVPIDELMEFLKDNLPSKEGSDYWKKRCEAAERYIELYKNCAPNHPDEMNAFNKWIALKQQTPGE